MRFRILGPVEIEADDGPVHTLGRRQERCLLAILLIEAGRMVPVDRLCQLLWDDDPPEQGRRAVHAHVARIRAVLARAGATGAELLSERDGYLLRVDLDSVDAHRFRSLLASAGATTDLGERDRMLAEALALWRGPALHKATASDRQWQRLCAGLEEQRRQAVEESIATGLELGRHRELLPELARLGAERPVRERLVELHMLALYRDGRTAEALDVYQQARDRIAEELGLDPGLALQQLHQAILRGAPIPVRTPAARPDDPVIPAQLPRGLPGFTGRAHPLEQLDALLPATGGGPTAVVISAIAGTAGVGKTTLAVHWAHRVADRFPDGQLYVNLRGFDPGATAMTPAEAVRGFLDAFQVPPQRIPASSQAQVGLYRSLLAGKRVLVLLDNAASPDQVRPLLPGAPGCLTLVTSRNQLTGLVATEGAHPLTLDLLTGAEARELLALRLGTDRVAAEPEAVDELVAACARLPLALAIVAARAATDRTLPLAELARQLRRAGTGLDAFSGEDSRTNVGAVFSWSYQALPADAARLFRLLGLHPGPDLTVPAAASLAGIPVPAARTLLDQLTEAHLVTQATPGRYTFHDLLRAFAAERAEAEDAGTDRLTATHRLLDHYLYATREAAELLEPSREPVTLGPAQPGVAAETHTDQARAGAWLAVERPVLVGAVRLAGSAGFDEHAWRLALLLATFLDRRGHWQDWMAVQHAALAATERLADRSAQAHIHLEIGRAHVRLGQHDDAHPHFQRALDLFTELGDLAGQARTHLRFNWVLDQQGRLPESLHHAYEARRLAEAAGHRRALAGALNAIGWLHALLGEYAQTLPHCQQAVTISQELDDEQTEADAWDSLGYAHHHLGQHEDAISCYRRAIDLFRKLGNRFQEADALGRLGDVHRADGDLDTTRDCWQRSVDILSELDHPGADAVRAKLDELMATL
jgi:DNA-binding SARP family transcriptional activator